jgi:arginyl-tRNA--protein-N-Asp/Glu arginylyltransferase
MPCKKGLSYIYFFYIKTPNLETLILRLHCFDMISRACNINFTYLGFFVFLVSSFVTMRPKPH